MARKKPSTANSGVQLPTPKTPNQKLLLNSLQTAPMTITIGPAGVGKTYLPAVYAAYALKNGIVDTVILTRPTVPTGRSIGFFPGTLLEKMAPWTKPILSTIETCIGKGDLESQLKNGNIEIVPFETIRGRSFDRAFVILDEAQNCTFEELKAFVTRIGEESSCVINGDTTQTDIQGFSGLSRIVGILEQSEALKRFVKLVEFDSDDIVRSGLTQMWVKEFENLTNNVIETPKDLPKFITKV